MTFWSDLPNWENRSPVLHHSGTIDDHKYVVIHTADGSYEGTIAWQKSTQSDNSSHFIVDFDGKIAQVNDTANRSGAQKAGNPYSIAIENAGNENTPLTEAQLTANAHILAKAHLVYGIPLQVTGNVNTRGLGHHSMGFESGVDWGHHFCPGEIIKGQKAQIVGRAVSILGGSTVAFTPQQEADILFTLGVSSQPTNPGPIHARVTVMLQKLDQLLGVTPDYHAMALAFADVLVADQSLPHITDVDRDSIASKVVAVFTEHLSA